MKNECGINPVICNACGTRFAIEDLPEEQYTMLQEQHYFSEYETELRMLLRVKSFYKRYPQAKDRIQWNVIAIMESADPETRRQFFSGIPADKIKLPVDEAPPELTNLSKSDAEVVEWLKTSSFSLEPRLRFVGERIRNYLHSVGRVQCLRCNDGILRLDPEHWVDPNFV